MPDKESHFTVTDRRKFTLEGDLRDGENQSADSASTAAAEESAAPAASPASAAQQTLVTPDDAGAEELSGPTAEESAQQSKDYQASTRQLDNLLRQANTKTAGAPIDIDRPMNFDRLVQSIYMTAAVQMGAGTAPNEQPRIDILGARQSIDMLGVLEEKTRGNLTEEEKRLLQGALFDLRMSFLEITNAIASSAQRPPQTGTAH